MRTDLVILAESQAHLQVALDAVHPWGLRWRFSFRTKSAVMVFGLLRDCSVHLGRVHLPLWFRKTGTSVSLSLPRSLGVLTFTWSALPTIASSTNTPRGVLVKVYLSLFLICVRHLRPLQRLLRSGLRW